LVDACGEAVEAEVRGEVPIVELVSTGVDVRLQGGNCIGEFRKLDSSQEDSAPGTIVVVAVELSLQAEVKKICLGEVEDVVGIGPGRDGDRDRRVKPRNSKFQNAPEVVVAVVGFVTDRCEDRAHLGGERNRDKPREKLHKTFTHGSISNEAEARGA
jgi:hypothetical protein